MKLSKQIEEESKRNISYIETDTRFKASGFFFQQLNSYCSVTVNLVFVTAFLGHLLYTIKRS